MTALLIALSLLPSDSSAELKRADALVAPLFNGRHLAERDRARILSQLPAAFEAIAIKDRNTIRREIQIYWDDSTVGQSLLGRVFLLYALNRFIFQIPSDYMPYWGFHEGPSDWKGQANIWPWVVEPSGELGLDFRGPFTYLAGPGWGPNPIPEFDILREKYPRRLIKPLTAAK